MFFSKRCGFVLCLRSFVSCYQRVFFFFQSGCFFFFEGVDVFVFLCFPIFFLSFFSTVSFFKGFLFLFQLRFFFQGFYIKGFLFFLKGLLHGIFFKEFCKVVCLFFFFKVFIPIFFFEVFFFSKFFFLTVLIFS